MCDNQLLDGVLHREGCQTIAAITGTDFVTGQHCNLGTEFHSQIQLRPAGEHTVALIHGASEYRDTLYVDG